MGCHTVDIEVKRLRPRRSHDDLQKLPVEAVLATTDGNSKLQRMKALYEVLLKLIEFWLN